MNSVLMQAGCISDAGVSDISPTSRVKILGGLRTVRTGVVSSGVCHGRKFLRRVLNRVEVF